MSSRQVRLRSLNLLRRNILDENIFGEEKKTKKKHPEARPRDGHRTRAKFQGLLKAAWTFGVLCGKMCNFCVVPFS